MAQNRKQRMRPLQRIVTEPITDATEIAAFEQQRAEFLRAAARHREANGVSCIVDHLQDCPTETVPALVSQLTTCLTSEQKRELYEWLASRLPIEVVQRFANQQHDKSDNGTPSR